MASSSSLDIENLKDSQIFDSYESSDDENSKFTEQSSANSNNLVNVMQDEENGASDSERDIEVNINKKINLSDFKLQQISEIYSSIEKGEIKANNLVFLDKELNKVRVLEIKKVPYSGMIYDVDVANDIVLVKRGKNATAVWSGNSNGGIFNLSYNHSGRLGDYAITYYANLTNGFNTIKSIISNFSVQNATIRITAPASANTTDAINVNGLINRYNGTDSFAIANNLFLMKLNNVTVSSDIYNHSSFTTNGYSGSNVNVSNVVQLNLTNIGNITRYFDDYTTTGYQIDANNYSNVGWISGNLFRYTAMSGNVGNVTYRFNAVTKFFNATAYVNTINSPTVDNGGNTSVWFSTNGNTWTILNSSTINNVRIGGNFSINGYSTFYVMVMSNVAGGIENPVTDFEVNYTQWQYSSIGSYISPNITLPNVTYTVLKWDRNLGTGGNIQIQLRESDDGISYGSWSNNYTNYLTNDISSFTKQYLQYRAWLSTTNVNYTPILQDAQILYFNASTNSTGGYSYNITIPTNNLGPLPFEVSIVQNALTGIVGLNTTNITVWARTTPVYGSAFNYTGAMANYSVYVNFTRSDTGDLVNGTIKTNLSNSSYSITRTCSGSSCIASWLVPNDFSYGNYTINISVYNESAYYINSTIGYNAYLEEKNTTGNLYSANKTITDYSYGSEYNFYWNVTINNTGKASMNNVHVYDYAAARGSAVQNITEVTPCTRVYPGQSCNANMLITLKSTASPNDNPGYFISWRANWTDNDGTITGGSGFIAYTDMYVLVVGNATLDLSSYSANLSMQHASSSNFSFLAKSTGSNNVQTVSISFLEGNITSNSNNISSSWFSILSTNPITSITAGSNSTVRINISVPNYTAPGNYTGRINLSADVGGEKLMNLSVVVLTNTSWYLTPSTNFSYNKSFSLNTAGEIGNFTITNIGNINLTINISYSPSGTFDYSSLGTNLFQTNYNVSNVITNPTSVNVTKNGSTIVTLYQKGSASARTDVGIIAKFYNESSDPSVLNMKDAWNIEEQAPIISYIWFYLYGVNGTVAEQNANVTIKVRATDDINLNESGATVNLSWSGGQTQANLESLSSIPGEYQQTLSNYIVLNYSANYTPTTSGAYTVSARVLDNSGKSIVSSSYTFTSYGTTTVGLSQNYSSITINNIDLNNKGIFYINYTINNTGAVRAYNPTLTFSANSSIVVGNYTFNNISANSKLSYLSQFNVSQLTAAGAYNVTATLTYTNPNTATATDSAIFTITVGQNKSFTYSPTTVVINTGSGSSNSSLLEINNTGNAQLTGMNLNCYTGTLCSSMTASYNESNFAIGLNSTRKVNITLTAPSGLSAGSYTGFINISEQSISNTFEIQSTVPQTKTWTVSPGSINITKGSSTSGNLQAIMISNTGNVNMTFNLGTTNSSLFNPNASSITVSSGSYKYFMVNYSSPSTEGNYFALITITNTDSGANPVQINVSINMTVTSLAVSIIYPTATNQLINLTYGQSINVSANLTYGGELVINSTSWNVTINGTACSNINYSYNNLANSWNISCGIPALSDGKYYSLSATASHSIYGERTTIEENAIGYRDVSPPSFAITRNSINKGASINLQANITDNVNVSYASALLTYPNSSKVNLSLKLSGGFYINNSIVLNDAGEYSVNYSANDTTNNLNSTIDWFEVYDRYYWNLKLLDYNSNVVANANITLNRPNTTTVLLNNLTGSNGGADFYVNKRWYDIHAVLSTDEVIVKNVNFTNVTQSGISFNFYRVSSGDLAETVSLHKTFQGIASNSTNLSNNIVSVVFNYSGANYDNVNELEVVKCANWNYSTRSCIGSWSVIASSIDKDSKKVTGNSTGFSAYFLSEDKCGNGACESNYGETTSTCSADCTTGTTTTINTGGGGGGGGGISSADLKKIEDIVKSFLNIGGIKLETTSIYKEMFAGETTTVRIKLKNTLTTTNSISLSATGDVKDMIFFEKSQIDLKPSEERDVLIKIVAPLTIEPGNYDGDLVLKSGKEEGKIPVTVRILAPEGKLLDVKIQPLVQTIAPGKVLRIQTDLLNLGQTKKVDVQFDLQLMDVETGEIFARQEESFAVENSISTIKNLTIPDFTKPGKYMLKGTAYYSNVEKKNMQASSIAYINVQYPWYSRNFLGIRLWIYFVLIIGVLVFLGLGTYFNYLAYQKKRFKTPVDVTKLPSVGPHSAFIGKVAETSIRNFIDLNKLQMHSLIAGATGGGKTIAAQDLIEAALLHKKSVIVFDPTAQWTGFFKKCDDKGMLKRYQYFDMKIKDARGFNGIIKTIHDPYELLDVGKYLDKEGEITIFDISKLAPKEMDVVVASTIQQIFKLQPEESKELKTLIVYDEVHRLLPKFGGSGEGFVQLERGVREFRKWGIGLVLISQVLSDFIGEIKANIGTEIQMGTRYEGDLERISLKYGEDILKAVVKEPIGTGMVVNAEYNSGRPYFVAFRPVMHSTKRLSNEELKRYEEYFDGIEDLEYQNEQLKKIGLDTLDLELELKLVRDKVKEGQFQMADMYLESLRPRFEESWKNLGKKPMHLVRERISKTEVEKGISVAKEEREKYLKKNPQQELSFDEKMIELKKMIEEKKKKGKDTSKIEMKINDLENRIKPFNGKIKEKDADGIKKEIEGLKLEVEKM